MKVNLFQKPTTRLQLASRGAWLAGLLTLAFGAQAQPAARPQPSTSQLTSAQPSDAALTGWRVAGTAPARAAQPLAAATVQARQAATPVATALAATSWTAVASLGQERSQHAAQASGNNIYVWGGYTGGANGNSGTVQVLSSLEIYDAATNTWRSGASVPTAMRGQASAVGSDGLIYSFGGAATTAILNVSYRYTPATDSWATLAPMPMGQWEASAARATDGRIYVFGGTSAGTANQIYTPTTNTWATGAAMPTSRHGTTAVRDASGLLHVMGGNALDLTNSLTTHEVYNPTTNTWTTAAPLPMGLNQAGATLGPDGNLYVVGGKQSYANNTAPFYSTVYVYTPSTNIWAQGPSLPLTLGETQAATVGSSVYTLAGTNGTQQKVAYQLAVGPSALVDANPAANTVVQNAAAGTAVGITASSTDPNGQAITYSLLNNAGGRFAINSTTGVVSVATGAQFPTAPTTYTITVQASTGAATTSQDFAIDVTVPLSTIAVQYQTGDLGQPTDNQLRPFLQLVNTGTTAVPYASLTVRYWLTVENFMGQLITPIDWAKLGTSFVSARYVALATPRQGAFGYIEYSFAAGAGNLAAGTDSGPIYGKAYKPDYTNFDETNDWSYQTSGSFTTNDHVTVYQNGTLINGTEPPAVASTTSIRVFAGNQDTSPTTSYINLTLQVGNVGNRPVSYSDLTVRYYFTRDGATSIVPTVDYAKLGASNISVRYVPLATPLNGADGYLELGFSSALGVFYPSTNTDNIQIKLRKGDYTAFTQTNDYSFSPSSAVVEQPRVPAYLNGVLVFGTEPAGAAVPASRMAASPALAAAAPSRSLPEKLAGSPNPFTDNVQLRFALPQAEAYTLAVYDGQGRLLEQLPGGTAEAGEPQQVAWSAGRYAAGLYLVRLVTPSTTQQFRLMKQ